MSKPAVRCSEGVLSMLAHSEGQALSHKTGDSGGIKCGMANGMAVSESELQKLN